MGCPLSISRGPDPLASRLRGATESSPNQVLTHAARAAAKEVPFQAPLVAARAARAKGSGQSKPRVVPYAWPILKCCSRGFKRQN